jgi:hypothetical protein
MGLIKAAKTTGAWIFTGGTNTGLDIFISLLLIFALKYSGDPGSYCLPPLYALPRLLLIFRYRLFKVF